jgi:hypothetical protein
VFAFHRPETPIGWVTHAKQLNQRLREMPPLITGHLWHAQIEGIRLANRMAGGVSEFGRSVSVAQASSSPFRLIGKSPNPGRTEPG